MTVWQNMSINTITSYGRVADDPSRGVHLSEDHKRWIAHGLKSAGTLTVDAGGAAALRKNGRSLLPVGVTFCEGEFDVGEAVTVVDPDGAEVAKGLVNYSGAELRKIMGKRAEEIERILGYRNGDEAIHRDNLVILG